MRVACGIDHRETESERLVLEPRINARLAIMPRGGAANT
jgi:hypothetical protein